MAPLHRATLRLRPTPPFDFAQSLAFLSEFPPLQGEYRIGGGELWQGLRVAEQTIVFRLGSSGSLDAPDLRGEVYCPTPIDAALAAAVHDRVGFYLSLDDDLRPFYALAATDPPFAAIVRQRYGFHQAKFSTPFEHACWAILGQRTPFAVARKMKAALVERGGNALAVDGHTYRAFPDAAQLAQRSEVELSEIIGNQRKGRYLAATAHAFVGVDEEFLRFGELRLVEQWLRAIPGIGAWSAAFVLVRGLGRMDVSPEAGREPLRAVEHVYGDQAEPVSPGARSEAGGALWGLAELLGALPAERGLSASESRV